MKESRDARAEVEKQANAKGVPQKLFKDSLI